MDDTKPSKTLAWCTNSSNISDSVLTSFWEVVCFDTKLAGLEDHAAPNVSPFWHSSSRTFVCNPGCKLCFRSTAESLETAELWRSVSQIPMGLWVSILNFGLTKAPFRRFISFWGFDSLPYRGSMFQGSLTLAPSVGLSRQACSMLFFQQTTGYSSLQITRRCQHTKPNQTTTTEPNQTKHPPSNQTKPNNHHRTISNQTTTIEPYQIKQPPSKHTKSNT